MTFIYALIPQNSWGRILIAGVARNQEIYLDMSAMVDCTKKKKSPNDSNETSLQLIYG